MTRFISRSARMLLALIFGAAGMAKLVNPAMFTAQFAALALPVWFITVTGACELFGAAMLVLHPRTRVFGAALLAMMMLVATILHLCSEPPGRALPAMVLAVLAAYVARASCPPPVEAADA